MDDDDKVFGAWEEPKVDPVKQRLHLQVTRRQAWLRTHVSLKPTLFPPKVPEPQDPDELEIKVAACKDTTQLYRKALESTQSDPSAAEYFANLLTASQQDLTKLRAQKRRARK